MARQVFKRMRSMGVETTHVTYSALIAAHVRGGVWEHAFEIYDAMIAAKHRPNVMTYGVLLVACHLEENWQRAEAYWAEAIKYRVDINMAMHNHYLNVRMYQGVQLTN